ncbi:RHS repeat domain-containing protein [Agromyces aerolatus]|uniref:RHS repeat domain-containing protein n=1 Tax=Agromyces sp. LY-1074 TaxID=3074080 RepID=UPI0028558EF0|nr:MULTISPECIES: RHS repeat-associated core domain-containing protein [unclassified Agromyces]MDR5699377.1 RHS repeat-associated core domain-containing protein [Agromyces sp. LY-1074]MDR5705673.1 RHS repeat-associated core domain-containing protein [Agromyces sp. LY-1358]
MIVFRGFRRPRLGGIAAAVASAALVTGSLTAADAEGPADPPASVVGGFSLGDGLEGTIDERVGAFRFTVPVGGLALSWDSRGLAEDRSELGAGWTWGLSRVETAGGVAVHPATGGRFPADATHPSGLAGYDVEDVVFAQVRGALPGRGVELPGFPTRIEYAYALHELGGAVTYFNATGDPVAHLDRFGRRTDWAWHDSAGQRLTGVIDPDGMVTTVDSTSEPGRVVVRPGASLAPGSESAGSAWRLDLDDGRVASVTDASGGRISLGYDRSGLVSAVSGVSGGITRVTWRMHADAVARVSSVRTTDGSGAELSRRDWEPGPDGGLSTGWPRHAGDAALPGSADPRFSYRSVLSDGATRVVSEYSSRHLLVHRATVAASAAGAHVVHEQTFGYPDAADGGGGASAAPPGNWSRPNEATITFHDRAGGERTASETFGFDARGRLLEHTALDGAVTTVEYDETVPTGSLLPIGLPVAETLTAPDGHRRLTRSTLRADRAAVVAVETSEGAPAGAMAVVARAEFEVRDDGFVSARREFAADGSPQPPATTTWDRSVDVAGGTAATTETTAAGSPAQVSTTEVTSLVHGGVLARTDPLGNTARTTFDAIGRPVRRRDRIPLASGERDGRSTTTEYEYDAHDRLIRSTLRDASAAPEVVTRETAYDLSAAGDVLAETTTTSPGTTAELVAARDFEYGARGELVARVSTEQTAHDEAVRREQVWDAAGNLRLGLDGTRYEYDAADRPVAEAGPDGSTIGIDYWADGTRRSVTTTRAGGAGATTEAVGFYWNGDTLLAETHTGGGAGEQGSATYLYGLGRHARTILQADGGDATSYYGTDRHGNVIETTDGAGRTIRRVAYDDYGTATDDAAAKRGLERDPFGFAGEYTDATGRQHLRTRTYDPSTRQFTTRDDADRHNRYAFADLNPIMNVDPSGRSAAPDGGHIAMLGLGLVLTLVIGAASITTGGTALGWFGVAIAVGGGLASGYSVAVSIGALVAQTDTARATIDPAAREFFESDLAWGLDSLISFGVGASVFLNWARLTRAASWIRQMFRPAGAAGAAGAAHAAGGGAGSRTAASLATEMATFAAEPAPGLHSAAIVRGWTELVAQMDAAPMAALNTSTDRLIERTIRTLEQDGLGYVGKHTIEYDGQTLTGFRAWLYRTHGVPPEAITAVYTHLRRSEGPFGATALAHRLKPLVKRVLAMHRQFSANAPADYALAAGSKEFYLGELLERLRALTRTAVAPAASAPVDVPPSLLDAY